jgi:hypothetical protein
MGTNRTLIKARDTSVMAGIDKYITAPITIAGTSYTPDALKAEFQAEITLLDRIAAQHKAVTDSVLAAKAMGKKTTTIYQLLRGGLLCQYGKNAIVVLHEFGMSAPKAPGAKTVEAKVTAQAKSAATRAARHTMGKAQKKAIKGDVTGITVTPVTSAPIPTVSKAP